MLRWKEDMGRCQSAFGGGSYASHVACSGQMGTDTLASRVMKKDGCAALRGRSAWSVTTTSQLA